MCVVQASAISPIYRKILSIFPQNPAFCFAYGSGVKKQLEKPQGATKNMIDLVYCVDDCQKWHEENMVKNSDHYSFLKYLGHRFVTKFQENTAARVYFNTLVDIGDVTVKYGVISRRDLVTDLLEWSHLYVAGRLHKPVEILKKAANAELQTALRLNLQSAIHASLLILPERFTEYEFYHTVSNLSYGGDFRMTFGENKNKIHNIVKPQSIGFRNLYGPLIKSLHDYVDFPAVISDGQPQNDLEPAKQVNVPLNVSEVESVRCFQDVNPLAKLHHLNQLPRWPQKALTRFWNQGSVQQDTEDVLRAIAYDPDCGVIVEQSINDIVWKSSVRQSLKGILTAGILKSAKYSGRKISKMLN